MFTTTAKGGMDNQRPLSCPVCCLLQTIISSSLLLNLPPTCQTVVFPSSFSSHPHTPIPPLINTFLALPIESRRSLIQSVTWALLEPFNTDKLSRIYYLMQGLRAIVDLANFQLQLYSKKCTMKKRLKYCFSYSTVVCAHKYGVKCGTVLQELCLTLDIFSLTSTPVKEVM